MASNDELIDGQSELEFLSAMNTYRAAKESGDAQATRDAEDALRERVRAELIAQMQGRQ